MEFKKYYQEHFKSKNQAAKMLGVSRPTIYKMLKGEPIGIKRAKQIENLTNKKIMAIELIGL